MLWGTREVLGNKTLAGRLRNDPSQVLVRRTPKTTITADKQRRSCSLSVDSLSSSSSNNKCLKLVQMLFGACSSSTSSSGRGRARGSVVRSNIASERAHRPRPRLCDTAAVISSPERSALQYKLEFAYRS